MSNLTELFKALHADKNNCRVSDELQLIGHVIMAAKEQPHADYEDGAMAELRTMHYMLDVVETRFAEAGRTAPNCVKLFLAELGEEQYVDVALRIFMEDTRDPYNRIKELFPNGALRATVAKQLLH